MNTKRLLFLPLLLFAVLVHADNTMFGDMAWRYGATYYSAPLSYYSLECNMGINGTKELNGKTYQQLGFRMNANGSRGEADINKTELHPFPNNGDLIGIRYENGRMLVDKEEYMALLADSCYWSAWGTATALPYETTTDGELVLYDFTKNEGDVYLRLADGSNITVTKAYSLKTEDGVTRRCLTLSNGLELIEGIGCINSPGMLLFWLNVQQENNFSLTVGILLQCSVPGTALFREDWHTHFFLNGNRASLLTEGRRWVYNYDNGQIKGTFSYTIEGDTIVNGYQGKKLVFALTDKETDHLIRSGFAGTLYAADYDNGPWIWYRAPNATEAETLYYILGKDYKPSNTLPRNQQGLMPFVVGIDYVSIVGENEPRVFLVNRNEYALPLSKDSLYYWVDGIGSSKGPLKEVAGPLADSIQFVGCYEGDECIFKNEDFYKDLNPVLTYTGYQNIGSYTHEIYLNSEMSMIVSWVGEEKPKGEVVIPEYVELWGYPCYVKQLGEELFKSCAEITSVTLPEKLLSIERSAFNGCEKLTSIELPKGLTSIGRGAFYSCGLTTISIPASVTSIGSSAFRYCSKLKDVYCWTSALPSVGNYAFRDIASDATLHVPAEALETYKSTAPWSDFPNIVAITETENISGTSANSQHTTSPILFDLQGRKVKGQPTRGIYIKDGHKVVIK